MSKVIRDEDLVQKDLFKGTREEAEKLVNVIQQMTDKFSGLLDITRQMARANKFNTYEDVQKAGVYLDQATKSATELEKAQKMLKVATDNLALAQKGEVDELTKTKLETQAATAETKRLAKEQTNLGNEYDRQSARLNNLRRAYKDLAAQGKENTPVAQSLRAEIEKLDISLKKIDADVGQFQRNVGNYGSAFAGAFDALNRELKQVQQEIAELDAAGKPIDDLKRKESFLLEVTKKLSKEYKTTTQQSRAFQEAARLLGVQYGENSEIFKHFREQVGEGVDALNDINDSIKLAASDTQGLDRLINAAQGIAGAFSVAEGAAALFGDENEDLQKTFVRLQATLTILNGLQAIQAELKNKDSLITKGLTAIQGAYTAVMGASTGAVKAFRLALISTGIGAFVVGLGVLIANFGKIKNVLGLGVNPATKKLAEETQKAMEASEKAMEAFENEERVLRALGFTEQYVADIRASKTKEALAQTQARLNIQKTILEETIKSRAKWKSLGFNLLGTTDKDVEEAGKILEELQAKIDKYNADLKVKRTEDYQRTINKFKTYEDEYIDALDEGLNKQLAAENLAYERRKKELEGNNAALAFLEIAHQNRLKKIREDFAQQQIQEAFKLRDLQIANMQEGFEKRMALEQLNYDRQKNEFRNNAEALKAIEEAHKLAIQKLLMDEYQLYLDYLNSLSDLQIEFMDDETEREIESQFRAKERRKKDLKDKFNSMSDEFKNNVDHQKMLQNALKLLDDSYTKWSNKKRADKKAADEKEADEKLKSGVEYDKELAEALLEQERKNFKNQEDWEKYKQKRLLEIEIEAIQKRLKDIEGLNDEAHVLERAQLEAQLADKSALLKQYNDSDNEAALKSTTQNLTKIANETDKFFKQQSDKRQAAFDKDVEASKKRQDELRALAIAGNKDAQASIAAEDKRQAELQRAKEKELKAQKRRELALSAINTYNSKVQAGDKNALANTIKDLALLSQAIATLPIFYEGTENTGPGGKVDSKGGFHAILHPGERVLTAAQNTMLGDVSNPEVANLMAMYNRGMLLPLDSIPAIAADSGISELKAELVEIKQAIQNKPEYSMEWDPVRKAVIETAKSTNNKTVTHTRFGGPWGR